MTLRRMARLEGDTVVAYVHNAAAEGMGKIGVLVALKGADETASASRSRCTSPRPTRPRWARPTWTRRSSSGRRQILIEQARESGKPEAVIEKMIEGRMKKFLAEVTLLGQSFVINPDMTVAQAAKDAGVEVTGFVRLAVGEGIEKEDRGLRRRGRQAGERLSPVSSAKDKRPSGKPGGRLSFAGRHGALKPTLRAPGGAGKRRPGPDPGPR